MRKLTTKEFIERAKKVHGDKYDYNLVDYKNNYTKIKIICSEHGIFEQTPYNHVIGKRCPECYGKFKLTTKEFIERAIKIHGNKYDYSYVNYIGSEDKVTIICKKCNNTFKQRPTFHLQEHGCPKCGIKKASEHKRLTIEEFIERAKKVHGDKYDYSKVQYVDHHIKVEIICKTCKKIFKQRPTNHIFSKNGCSHCKKPKGEIKVLELLEKHNIEFITQKTFDGCRYKLPLRFDIYIQNIGCIEYNGIQHYEPNEYFGIKEFKDTQLRDKIKIDYCRNNNIPLYIIRYDEDIKDRMKEILK